MADSIESPRIDFSSLTHAQIAQLANNYKLTPTTLFAELNDWWIAAPWLRYLGAEIASAIARGNCGLLISAPPRHGKSKLITVATPLWVLENFPKKNVIVATYGEDLSTDFTRETKDLIKAYPDKLSIRIRRDVDRAQNFVTPQGGGLKAVGLRGTITGRGADVLIIDDYIKEPKEALNFNYLESLKTWYATVARTRLEPGAVVIIVATRWVTNDLHGHIIRLEARKQRKFYRIIQIPAIAGKLDTATGEWYMPAGHQDILGRKAGEPLFAARYNREQLEDIRLELGNRWFEAMFQQNPASEDSAVTNPDNLQYITQQDFQELLSKWQHDNPHKIKRRRSWDLASTKNAGDFTAGALTTYNTLTEDFYIEGMKHGQWSAGHVETVFLQCAASGVDGRGDSPDVEIIIEQEPGSAGKYAVKHFHDLVPNRRVRFVNTATEGSKLLKAQPFLAATEKKKVWIVVDDINDHELTPWVSRFVDEFAAFPEGGHDDMMDAICTGYNDSTGKRSLAGAWGRSKQATEAQERYKGGELTEPGLRRTNLTFGRSSAATVGAGAQKYITGNRLDQNRKAKVYGSKGAGAGASAERNTHGFTGFSKFK